MTEHTLARVGRCCSHADISLEVRYEGGDYRSMRHWLGRRFRFRRQGKGDLGMRMSGAVRDAFLAGAQRVVLVGTDCPKLQEAHIRDAFHALRKKPLVLGPARDGGYYLIALRRNSPELFEDIEWGTHRVLDQTLARARMLGLEPELLEVLDDIDRPEDLPIWEQERGVC